MPDRILQFLFHFFLTSVQCRQFFPGMCPRPAILSWYLSKTGTYYFFLCAKFFLCANSFHLPGTCVVLTVIFGE
ncbi:hypothetical protein SAMN04487833_101146 [Sarcina sp. DSM 11001]|nr:hypothetical protein SAMN04487833_101146 [Sarcina sp. DSM 11001]